MTVNSDLVVPGIAAALACMVFSRQAGTLSLFALAVLAPLFNPAVAGTGDEGRLYLSSILVLLVIVAGVGSLVLTARPWPRSVLLVTGLLVGFTLILYRPGPDFAGTWIYRPLQPILLALVVTVLLRDRVDTAKALLRVAVLAGSIGAGLGFVNGAIPVVDPFAASRPADLAYRASLGVDGGVFLRAAGAFVYPNVFGLFCAYLVICAIGAVMYGAIRRRTAACASVAGLLGLLGSGARADLGGLVCALLLLGWLTDRRRRVRRVLGALAGVSLATLLLAQTSVGASVIRERIASIAGTSGESRRANADLGWQTFIADPVTGTGARISRLDNGVLLYLSLGGVAGFVLICAALFFVARADGTTRRGWASIPIPSRGLLVALASSSVLQDSLGQTLSSYLLGLGLGLFAVLPQPNQVGETRSAENLRGGSNKPYVSSGEHLRQGELH